MPKNNGGTPPVWVSQNFLTSRQTLRRLLRIAGLNQNDTVIEIGAGKGHITDLLLKNCGQVTAYEIDEKLCRSLRQKFSNAPNLTLKQQDFLSASLPRRQEYKIFANIPFHITTKIMKKLADCENPPTEAWLVMEKGAAKRFCGGRDESLYSLLLKPFFELKMVYHFQRTDFHPMPAADIVLLHMKRSAHPDVPDGQKRLYSQFIRRCLQDDGLKTLLTKKKYTRALSRAARTNDTTSGDTLYIQWLCLFRSYADQFGGKSRS